MAAADKTPEGKHLIEFDFEGKKYQVVSEAAKDYKLCKHLSCPARYGMDAFYSAIETLFDGHDDEYVEQAGGMFRLNDLIGAALQAVGSKNS